MKLDLKTILRIGAAVLVGAVVFIGSSVASKSEEKAKNNPETVAEEQPKNLPGEGLSRRFPGQPFYGNGQPVMDENNQVRQYDPLYSADGRSTGGIGDLRNAMTKATQFLTLATGVVESVGKLVSAAGTTPSIPGGDNIWITGSRWSGVSKDIRLDKLCCRTHDHYFYR